MRRIILIALAIFASVHDTFAYDYSFYATAPTGQTLYYKINGNNVSVCCAGTILPFRPWGGYTQPTGNLTIPSSVTYNNTTYSVTEIGQDAFFGCTGLASVVIPNTVTKISYEAFEGCSGLTSVTFGNSVTHIYPDAFNGCSSLSSLTIPNSLIWLGSRAFANCSGLTTVSLGSSIGLIAEYAFQNCTGLTSIAIPNSLLTLERYAFSSCTSLTSVTIGNSVNQIGDNPFRECRNIASITVSSSNTYYDSRNNCNAIIKTSDNKIITGCKNTVIPNTVTSIGNLAFYGCSNLYSITIPNSINSIALFAFKGCNHLVAITSLATTAPILGYGAFEDVPTSIPIYIPCGSASSYNTEWIYFSNIIETLGFHVNISSDNSTMGHTQILSEPNCIDSTAIISAIAHTGYHFTHWNDGNTDNPRQVFVSQDLEFTAYFAIDTHTVFVISNDTAYGRVEGGGLFEHGTHCTVSAEANNGYHFMEWSNGTTDNPYTFSVIEDTELTAIFEEDGGGEGIDDIDDYDIHVYSRGNHIVVEGVKNEAIYIFNIMGQQMETHSLPAGVYLVKIGNKMARKVVVIK